MILYKVRHFRNKFLELLCKLHEQYYVLYMYNMYINRILLYLIITSSPLPQPPHFE